MSNKLIIDEEKNIDSSECIKNVFESNQDQLINLEEFNIQENVPINFDRNNLSLTVSDINELQEIFQQELLDKLPRRIVIDGIIYVQTTDHVKHFAKIFNENKRAYVIYKLSNNSNSKKRYDERFISTDNPTSIQNCLLFMWHCVGLTIHPDKVQYENDARLIMSIARADNHHEDYIHQTEDIILLGFNDNQHITAKVDTGASLCSLHADDIVISNNVVQFKYKKIFYKMNLDEIILVNSPDGGEEKRPVVRFDIMMNGTTINNVQFNLNDRKHMDTDALIGANLIKQGDFKIDL